MMRMRRNYGKDMQELVLRQWEENEKKQGKRIRIGVWWDAWVGVAPLNNVGIRLCFGFNSFNFGFRSVILELTNSISTQTIKDTVKFLINTYIYILYLILILIHEKWS